MASTVSPSWEETEEIGKKSTLVQLINSKNIVNNVCIFNDNISINSNLRNNIGMNNDSYA